MLTKMEDPMKSNVNSAAAEESQGYRFVVSRSKGSKYETDGLRQEFVYRDLGLADATHGKFHAHIIKAKHLDGETPMRLRRARASQVRSRVST